MSVLTRAQYEHYIRNVYADDTVGAEELLAHDAALRAQLNQAGGVIMMREATLEQVRQDRNTVLAKLATAENELCTAKDQIPPDMEDDSLSVALIKLKDERRQLKAKVEALVDAGRLVRDIGEALCKDLPNLYRGNIDVRSAVFTLLQGYQSQRERLQALERELDEKEKRIDVFLLEIVALNQRNAALVEALRTVRKALVGYNPIMVEIIDEALAAHETPPASGKEETCE